MLVARAVWFTCVLCVAAYLWAETDFYMRSPHAVPVKARARVVFSYRFVHTQYCGIPG